MHFVCVQRWTSELCGYLNLQLKGVVYSDTVQSGQHYCVKGIVHLQPVPAQQQGLLLHCVTVQEKEDECSRSVCVQWHMFASSVPVTSHRYTPGWVSFASCQGSDTALHFYVAHSYYLV